MARQRSELSVEDYILTNTIRTAGPLHSDCWVWQRALRTSGYGAWTRRSDGLHGRYAHAVSYETFVGPIPDGLQIDHLCRTRACVNPAHLEPVTQRENMQRAGAFRRAPRVFQRSSDGLWVASLEVGEPGRPRVKVRVTSKVRETALSKLMEKVGDRGTR
jgi:hypothetical protein